MWGDFMRARRRAAVSVSGACVLLVAAAIVASGPSGAAATVTVKLSSAVVHQVEGNTGSTPVTVSASLSAASSSTVTVDYATADGTAKASDGDYVATSGTLSFAPGVVTRPITVQVKGDTKLENYETFTVKLSNPTNATLGNATEKVEIQNDDAPQLSMPDVVVPEGQTATFVPKLLQRFYAPLTVTLTTSDGSAVAPGDYASTTKSVTFAAGATTASTMGVPTVADGVPEGGETFTVTASGPIAATVRATGTIAWHLQSATFPIRGAFYYGWFPGTWSAGTWYHPLLGQYSSSDSAVIAQHIAWMQQAKVQVGIASWWGPGHATDSNLTAELAAASGTGFQWSAYYEAEGYGSPSASKIGSDLAALWGRAQSASWLHIGGKPVIFVYGSGADGCGTVTRWNSAPGRANWFVVMKVFSGYASCANQPDDWHQYAPANAVQAHLPHSYVISPGFWKYGETTPRLARDVTRWAQNVRDMVASGAHWQLVTTFNEWGEGTGVEPTTEFGTAYLDVLAHDGN
jgi:hypothetical protein